MNKRKRRRGEKRGKLKRVKRTKRNKTMSNVVVETKGGNVIGVSDVDSSESVEFSVTDTSSTPLELATKVLTEIVVAQIPPTDPDNHQEVLDAAKESAASTAQSAVDKAAEYAAAAGTTEPTDESIE